MKNTIAASVISLLLSPALCSAQETAPPETAPAAVATISVPPATKLEAFLGKRGLLVIRDFQESGKIEQTRKSQFSKEMLTDYYVMVTALTVYEPGKETASLKGLQVSMSDFRGVTKYGTGFRSGLSFVDLEEADSLSKALQYLVDLADKWKGQDVGSKEAYFTTKDDLKVLLAQTNAKPASFYLTIDGNSITLSLKEISQLKMSVDIGVKLLEGAVITGRTTQ
jgi:hypothetical protein